MVAIATSLQVANATDAIATLAPMKKAVDQEWRQERLRALYAHQDFEGRKSELAKALEVTPSYIGQLERGERAITEKFVSQVESMRGGKYRGWFKKAAAGELSPEALSVARFFDNFTPERRPQAMMTLLDLIGQMLPPGEDGTQPSPIEVLNHGLGMAPALDPAPAASASKTRKGPIAPLNK